MAKRKPAKRPSKPKPDEDGYVTTGIYSYFVGTPETHPEEFKLEKARHRSSLPRGSARDYFLGVANEVLALIKELSTQATSQGISDKRFRSEPLIADACDTADLAIVLSNRSQGRDTWDDYMLQACCILGHRVERLRIFRFEHFAAMGQRRSKQAAEIASLKSKLNDKQLVVVYRHITQTRKTGLSVKVICDGVITQLNAGVFRPLNGVVANISSGTLQNKYSARNKKHHAA